MDRCNWAADAFCRSESSRGRGLLGFFLFLLFFLLCLLSPGSFLSLQQYYSFHSLFSYLSLLFPFLFFSFSPLLLLLVLHVCGFPFFSLLLNIMSLFRSRPFYFNLCLLLTSFFHTSNPAVNTSSSFSPLHLSSRSIRSYFSFSSSHFNVTHFHSLPLPPLFSLLFLLPLLDTLPPSLSSLHSIIYPLNLTHFHPLSFLSSSSLNLALHPPSFHLSLPPSIPFTFRFSLPPSLPRPPPAAYR